LWSPGWLRPSMAHELSRIRSSCSRTDRYQVFQKSAWNVLPDRSPITSEFREHPAAMRFETPAHGLPPLGSRPGQTVGPPCPPLSAHTTVDLESQRCDHDQVLTGTESRRDHDGVGTSRTAIRSEGKPEHRGDATGPAVGSEPGEPGRHVEPFTSLARDAPIRATEWGRSMGHIRRPATVLDVPSVAGCVRTSKSREDRRVRQLVGAALRGASDTP
jgi:hypothetical protein